MGKQDKGFVLYEAFKTHLDGINYEGYTEQLAQEDSRLFSWEWDSFKRTYHFKEPVKTLTISNQPQGDHYTPGFKIQGRILTDMGFQKGDVVNVFQTSDSLIITRQM